MPRTPAPKSARSKGRAIAGGQSKAALAKEIGVSRQCLNQYLEAGAPPGPAASLRKWIARNINPVLSTGRKPTPPPVEPLPEPPPSPAPVAPPSAAAEPAHLEVDETPMDALDREALDLNQTRLAKLRQEVRKLEIANARAELELSSREGELLDRAEVERTLSELVIAVRTQFELIPEQLRPRFPRELQEDLVLEVRQAIEFQLRIVAAWRISPPPLAEGEAHEGD